MNNINLSSVINIPINVARFFDKAHACYDYSIYRDEEGQLVLRIDDYGKNPSLFTIEELGVVEGYATLYTSHNSYYFLLIEDLDEEGGRRIYVEYI